MAETNNVQSVTDFAIADKSISSKLPEKLANALITLPRQKELRLPWQPDDNVTADLEKAEQRVSRLTSAFAAKDKFEEKALILIRQNLNESKSKVSAIVSKAMNLSGSKLRQGIMALNQTIPDRKLVLSVDTKDRRFVFSVEEKPDTNSEVDALLEEAGL
jgi:hypothetical protein